MNANFLSISCTVIYAIGAPAESQPGAVLEAKTVVVKPPPLWQVVLLNDDYTPMEFVVYILEKLFGKSTEQATQIMLQVHHNGRGICGVYPKDIAATKVNLVHEFAQKHQHPLQCEMEAID